MDREQQLLAIVQAQTEIAAARPEPDAVMQIVAALALEVIGAQAAAVELAAGGHEHLFSAPSRLTGWMRRSSTTASRSARSPSTPTSQQAFTAADSETLTLLAGAVAAHLAHRVGAGATEPACLG